MPIYRYRDVKTGKEIDVLRSFAEYETPPTKEEGADGTEEWIRVLSGFDLIKSDRWGPGKGHWILPFLCVLNWLGN